MYIAIDGRFASGQRTGVGRYTLGLISSLAKLIGKNQLTLFFNDDFEEIENKNVNFLKTSIIPESHPLNELWENLVLPMYLRRKKIEIFHSPAFFLPVFKLRTKKIVTIPDLAVFKYPDAFPCKFSKYLQFMIKQSVKRADRIIAVSNFVKDEIINLLRVKEEKISVIYLGIDPPFIPPSEREAERIDNFREARGLSRGFILYAGTIEPRKNIINLIRAFSILKQEGFKHKLVLGGKKGWLYEDIFKESENSRFKEDIIFTEYIPDEELRLYYSSCDTFVYPSIYEGFGLPPLEAMSCAAPVVVSDIPVFREVLGDAPIFVDAYRPESIAEGIDKILMDTKLREEMILKGKERAKSFTWGKTAKDTLKLYEECMVD